MAQLSDLFSKLFASGPAKGLSGDSDQIIDDPQNAYFINRLRRHSTTSDLIDDPFVIWSSFNSSRKRSGLREHLLAQREEGPADFTDILVVVNDEDFRRTFNQVAEPWVDGVARVLSMEFEDFCKQEGFELLFASRGVRFQVIQDGASEMKGHSLDLKAGEFVTGLLPNLYTGPTTSSRPIISVHLNLPGTWDGYHEVGRLYSDQVQFTLGSHWLDNASYPELKETALYRLHQYLDGSFVHVINPDLQDRYEVSSDETEGPSVLTIFDREQGADVAYLVLALMDSFISDVGSDSEDEEERSDRMSLRPAETDFPSLSDPPPPTTPPNTPRPNNPRPYMPRQTLPPSTAGMLGQKTIVPDSLQERILTLKERGALLQKVHFRKFMRGYDVYVSSAGTISTHNVDPAATFQVRENQVRLVVHKPKVAVNGQGVELNRPLAIDGNAVLQVGPHKLEYNDLSGVRIDGWPYLGEILRPASSSHLVFGGSYRIGRDRRCKIQLPDEPQNDNIVWLDAASEGSTIRARSGDIPKSRFYTDSIMVASEHAEIDLTDQPTINAIARHCFTYLRRTDGIIPLYPTNHGGNPQVPLQVGDDILVGNCLFQISYPPTGSEAQRSSASTSGRLTAESLAMAVDADLETVPPPPPPNRRILSPRERLGQVISGPVQDPNQTTPPDDDSPSRVATPPPQAQDPGADLPPAAGLGELGPAPTPPKIELGGFDSILGLEPPNPRGLMSAPAVVEATPSPAAAAGSDASAIVAVDEEHWQLELARPARLALIGWAISGEAVVGNYRGCAVVVPESRSHPDQQFQAAEYFRLKVRGSRGKVILLDTEEARLRERGEDTEMARNVDAAQLEVIRRDRDGDEDFSVLLDFNRQLALPDPRARLLALDTSDRMALALFTVGLPQGAPRGMDLGPIRAQALYSRDSGLSITNYLESYRGPDGRYLPFMVSNPGEPFRTAPEDGTPVQLRPGALILVDKAVYEFTEG